MSKPFVKKPVPGWKVLLALLGMVLLIYVAVVSDTDSPRYVDRSERTETEKQQLAMIAEAEAREKAAGTYVKAEKTKPVPKPKRRERPDTAHREAWSGTWPLTIDGGMLTCTNVLRAGGQPAVYLTTRNGDMWPLNGVAKAHHSSFGAKPDITPIWRDNPDLPGTKVNIGPLVQKGLRLCR